MTATATANRMDRVRAEDGHGEQDGQDSGYGHGRQDGQDNGG